MRKKVILSFVTTWMELGGINKGNYLNDSNNSILTYDWHCNSAFF